MNNDKSEGEESKQLTAFAPIVDENSRVVILGSMPGEQSLMKQQYYGHPRNHFWPLLFDLFNTEVPADYMSKLQFALAHHIAIWDVLQACERKGSLDSAILHPVANDFAAWFGRHPQIHSIFLNGATAEKLFRRYVLPLLPGHRLAMFTLPSTSPARTLPFAVKRAAWQAVLDTVTGSDNG